jgi:hypothetical protein
MKKIALSIVFVAVAATCSAQTAVYNYSTRIKSINSGNEVKVSESGKMFYDFATTNSITVIVNAAAKRVQTIRSINQAAVVINGQREDTFTALVTVPTNALPPGGSIFLGSPIFGKNADLKISSTQTVTFPKVFNQHMEDVSYGPPGDSWYTRSDAVYTFSPAATQTANAKAESIDDASQAMVDALVAKGYQSF